MSSADDQEVIETSEIAGRKVKRRRIERKEDLGQASPKGKLKLVDFSVGTESKAAATVAGIREDQEEVVAGVEHNSDRQQT